MKRIFTLFFMFVMFVTTNSFAFNISDNGYKAINELANVIEKYNEGLSEIRENINYTKEDVHNAKKRAEEIRHITNRINKFDYVKGSGEMHVTTATEKCIISFDNWKVFKTDCCSNDCNVFINYLIEENGFVQKISNKSGEYINTFFDLKNKEAKILDVKVNSINLSNKDKAIKVLDGFFHLMGKDGEISQLKFMEKLITPNKNKAIQNIMEDFVSKVNEAIKEIKD